MSKPKPPQPANDHPTAPSGGGGLDHLTDKELDARLEAAGAARDRAMKLLALHIRETAVASINATLGRAEGD